MAEVLVLDRTKSLIKRPVFDFLDLVSMCEHGPVSREQFALHMLKTHKAEFELLINSASTPEMQQRPDGVTMGEYMFPRHQWHELIEVNRTLQMIYLWVLIVAGRYDLFTECQKPEIRLSAASFGELQQMVGRYLGDDPFAIIEVIQRLKIVMAGMSVHDAGKNRGVVSDLLKSVGVTASDFEDHDSLLKVLLKEAPQKISESFARMTNGEREILEQFFSVDLILGQIAQGEATGVDIQYSGLRLLSEKTRFMWYMKETLDIAGAVGQSIQNGSIVLTELTWRGITQSIAALERYANHAESGVKTMDSLLAIRVGDHVSGELEADGHSNMNNALGRLAMMNRKFTKEEILGVYSCLKSPSLSDNAAESLFVRDLLVEMLSADGTNGTALLLYYAPGLFANLTKHLGNEKGMKTTLCVLANIFDQVKKSGFLVTNGKPAERTTLFLEELTRRAILNADRILDKDVLVLDRTPHGEINVSFKKD